MAKDVTFSAIDVGTTKVLTLIGRHDGMGGAEILGAGLAPSSGLRKGIIVDAGEAQESISASLNDARQAAGVAPASAFVTVSGVHVESYPCAGTLHSTRQNVPVSQAELDRALAEAHPMDLPPRKTVLHKLPRTYSIDGLNSVRNPIGMHALRIDVEAVCMAGDASAVSAVVNAVESARVRVEGVVAAPLAVAEAVLTEDEMERGVVVMDIGGGVTTLAMYRQGALWSAGVLPLGGSQFTSDLSVALNISYEGALELKERHGVAALDVMGDDEAVAIEDPAEGRFLRVERRTIARYLHERAGELFKLAALKLRGYNHANLPPGGLVLTGGGSSIRGIERVARQVLGSPVRFALPDNPALPYDLRDPAFSAGIGAFYWAARRPHSMESMRGDERRHSVNASHAQATASRLGWLKGRMSKVAS